MEEESSRTFVPFWSGRLGAALWLLEEQGRANGNPTSDILSVKSE